MTPEQLTIQWQSSFQKVCHHVLAFNSMPSQLSSDEYVRKIGLWVVHQRQNYKKGRLSQAQIKQLEVIPGWMWVGIRGPPRRSREVVTGGDHRSIIFVNND